MKFSFNVVIQDDLVNRVDYWNDCKIRTFRLSDAPDGRPSVIYKLPEKYVIEDHKIPVNTIDLNLAKRLYSAASSQFCCSNEFSELALMIMEVYTYRYVPVLRKQKSFILNLWKKLVNSCVL